MEKNENMKNNEINVINKNKTFNKLRDIQKLIKKESFLKGLCKYI